MVFEKFVIITKNLILMVFAVAVLVVFSAIQAPDAKAFPGCGAACFSKTPVPKECGVSGAIVDNGNQLACIVNTGVISDLLQFTGWGSCLDTINNMACQENSCPSNFNNANGTVCQIMDSTLVGISCATTALKTGKWDASESKCVFCSGLLENNIYNINNNIVLDTPGNGKFEKACDNSIDSACDEKGVGDNCGGTSTCNASGRCVAPNSLTLSIVSAPNPVPISGTSIVTFTVKKSSDDSAVSGAAVAVTSISCGTLPNPTNTTNSSGQTTSTFTAPGSAAICTIDAEATLSGYLKGTANYPITVTSCVSPNTSTYLSPMYAKGETLTLRGHNTQYFSLCIYNDSGVKKANGLFDSFVTKEITFVSDSLGTWKGLAIPSPSGEDCPDPFPDPFNIAQGCPSSTQVVECYSGHPGLCTSGCDLATKTCIVNTGCTDNTCDPTNTKHCVGGNWVDCPSGETCSGAGVCSGGGPTISFDASCYQKNVSLATISFTGAATPASLKLISPPGGTGGCILSPITAANGSVSQTLDANGVWKATLHNGADCTGTVQATTVANPTVQDGVCSSSCTANTCNPSNPNQHCVSSAWVDCPTGETCSGAGLCVPIPSCSGPGMYRSPLIGGYCTIPEIIAAAINWILGLVSAIIILILIFGGITYVTSAGEEDKIRTAKNIILYAIIGLAIILLAYTMINEVKIILKIIP